MEQFEYQGFWWLPQAPEERVPGTLTFDPVKGATLSLLGSFEKGLGNRHVLLQPQLILGFSSKGKPITLLGCAETKSVRNLGSPGLPLSTFRADTVFVGHHFHKEEEVGFEKLSVEFLHLDEWADISGFELKIPKDQTLHPMAIEHKRPGTVTASVGEAEISLGFRAKLKESNPLVRWASLHQTAYLAVEYPERRAFDELSKIVHHLRNFLTLGVGRPVRPLAILGRVGPEGERPVEVYYRPVGTTDSAEKKVFPPQMLFAFHDLPGGLELPLNNWLDKAEILEPVYQLYFGTVYNPRAYLEQRFLGLIQAVESYHRRVMPTTDLPEEEHERRKEEILEAVPDHHRDWLGGKLEYSNEPGLGRRIKEVIRKYPESLYPIAGGNKKKREKFVRKVVDTRNYRTHFDEKLEDRAAWGEELYRISQKLKLVLEVCLMGEIGFEDDQIRELLSKRLV